MPRTARASAGNYCYHVLNRGNGRQEVFHEPADYAAFLELMAESFQRPAGPAMRIVGYCLLPNHFHLVLWPRADGDLSRWMQWLLTSHIQADTLQKRCCFISRSRLCRTEAEYVLEFQPLPPSTAQLGFAANEKGKDKQGIP